MLTRRVVLSLAGRVRRHGKMVCYRMMRYHDVPPLLHMPSPDGTDPRTERLLRHATMTGPIMLIVQAR